MFWSEGMLPRYSWPTSQSFLRTYLRYDIMILLAFVYMEILVGMYEERGRESSTFDSVSIHHRSKILCKHFFFSSCQVVHYDRR